MAAAQAALLNASSGYDASESLTSLDISFIPLCLGNDKAIGIPRLHLECLYTNRPAARLTSSLPAQRLSNAATTCTDRSGDFLFGIGDPHPWVSHHTMSVFFSLPLSTQCQITTITGADRFLGQRHAIVPEFVPRLVAGLDGTLDPSRVMSM